VAEVRSLVIGFIHYVMHEDIIDGGLNSFITAFYVSPAYRGKGVGTLLLTEAIEYSLAMGAVGIETSTIHASGRSCTRNVTSSKQWEISVRFSSSSTYPNTCTLRR
jgi:GNAT superfamily N-acetyltransferase